MNAENVKTVPKDWFGRLQVLKNLVNSKFSGKDVPNLLELMSKIAHYHYNKKKLMLVGVEWDLYKFLKDNGYNPYTVYKWLLLENVPEDVRFRLRNNQLSQKDAFNLKFERRKPSEEISETIKFLGMKLVRGM